jgi:hypothetical protein
MTTGRAGCGRDNDYIDQGQSMSVHAMGTDFAAPESSATGRSARIGRWLLAGAAVAMLASGALLWWRHGASIFGEYALAALAWCF